MPIAFFPDEKQTLAIIAGRGDLAMSAICFEDNTDTRNILLIELSNNSLPVGTEYSSENDGAVYTPVVAHIFETPESVDAMIKQLQFIREQLTCCDLKKCRVRTVQEKFCQWCAKGDAPVMLDEDGVKCSITGKSGVLSHASDDKWWACEAVPTSEEMEAKNA